MKKIILLLIAYFLLGCISVSANRYSPHSRAYSTPGPMTLCDDDGQGAAKTCVQLSGLPAAGTAGGCTASSIPVSPSGTMTCLYSDEELPTVTDNYTYDGGRINGASRTITLSPVDTGGSGISTTKWCEGVACNPATGTVGTVITRSANYDNTIRYQTWDISGNASIIGSVIVKIDNSAPTLPFTYLYPNTRINGTQTITLNPIDTGGSGISTTKWCEGVACNPATGTVGTVITKGLNFDNTIRFQTWDNAGNSSAIGSVIVKIDNSSPTITFTYLYPNTRINGTQTITLNPVDTGGSGINTTKWCEGSSCNPGTTGTVGTVITKGGNYDDTIRFQTWDNAGNASAIGSVIVKIDNTFPTVDDITSITPNGNFLATHTKVFQVNVNSGGLSPIVSAISFFENYDTANSLKGASDECIAPAGCNQSIQNVDNNIDAILGGRDYSLQVSMVCDGAGNCLGDGLQSTNLKTFNVYVYSNSLLLSGSVITNDLINSLNVADGTPKNLTIGLRDTYGNIVIDSSGISRKIDFTFYTDNDLYLNQYIKTGNGVYLNTTTDTSNYLNRFPFGGGITTFTGQTSTDGNYSYQFKVYSPTKEVDEKAYGNFDFSADSKADITDTVGGNKPDFILDNSKFRAKFLPIYYTTVSGGIKNDGMIEGAVQCSNINISKNATSETTDLKKLYIEFGSGNLNTLNPYLDLKYGTGVISVNNNMGEGNTHYTIYKPDFVTPVDNTICTKLLLQSGGTLSDIQNSYFSTHISYRIIGPDGIFSLTPVLNSDVYGKNSYWGTIGTGGTYASAVKVIGKTYSKSFKEILQNQSSTQVNLLNGNITKSSLKTEVRTNAYNLIRNTPLTTTGTVINTTNDFTTNVDGIKLLSGSILYFGGLNGTNVTIENPLDIVGNKTILVEGGNLYIKKNINVSGNKSLLSIVVLKDVNGKGGNVYIDPSISYIKSIIYADKSLISYDGVTELGGNTEFSVLKNQLYILGSVFSENTTGGSRSTPIKCPYYLSSCLDQETAQIYDLNYLRRYYLKDTNSDGEGDTPAGGGLPSSPYITSSSSNYKYPLVIEYNPLIQTDPPFIFRK